MFRSFSTSISKTKPGSRNISHAQEPILLKFVLPKGEKQEVIKFGSHSSRSFRVAANSLMAWDKNPLPSPSSRQ